jgi:hypothetical protein
MITVCSLLILLPGASKADSAGPDSSKTATAEKIRVRDSLMGIQDSSKRLYAHAQGRGSSNVVTAADFFCADATAPSEAVALSPFCVTVPFGLSSQLNRFLVYGNVAPVAPLFANGPLLCSTFDPCRGTDDICVTEFSSITLGPGNASVYAPRPGPTASPEASILWENGVFGEDLLNVRFTRPLSSRLSVNAASNYRHFNNVFFSHDGNGVYSFYRSLTRDTGLISNRGYNPLTTEYSAGLTTLWSGKNGGHTSLSVKYADLAAEMALNRQGQGNLPAMGRLNQYRTTVDLGSVRNRAGPLVLEAQARLENAALVRYYPDSANLVKRRDGANREISLGARAFMPLGIAGEAGLRYRMVNIERQSFDGFDAAAIEHAPAFEGRLPWRLGPVAGSCSGAGGIVLYGLRDSLDMAPDVSAGAEAEAGGQAARIYVRHTGLPWYIPYDTTDDTPYPYLDRCRIGGGEITLHSRGFGIVLGCQSIEGIQEATARKAWPANAPPYEQPHLVFLAAPALGPWRGLTLDGRVLVSDIKPLVKARGAVAWSIHPVNTREFIDLKLHVDYWSGRDSVVFAAIRDWGRPICNAGGEIAFHISDFRFFGKVDNLLNRKFAYVPGYYTPGITFRWGFNWYLQK